MPISSKKLLTTVIYLVSAFTAYGQGTNDSGFVDYFVKACFVFVSILVVYNLFVLFKEDRSQRNSSFYKKDNQMPIDAISPISDKVKYKIEGLKRIINQREAEAFKYEKELKEERVKSRALKKSLLKQNTESNLLRNQLDSNNKIKDSKSVELEAILLSIRMKLGLTEKESITPIQSRKLILDRIDEIQHLDEIITKRKNLIEGLNDKISQGNTDEVIKRLMDYAKEDKNKDLLKKVRNISSRYKIVNQEKNNNTIGYEDSSKQVSLITKSIIDLLSELEEEN